MRIRLHTVIVTLLLIAGCSSDNRPEAGGPVAATPDEWASMRAVDACAILDETALAPVGKVSDRKYAGASVHSCVATLTTPDGATTTARSFVGERITPEAQAVSLGDVQGYVDTSCTVGVKVSGDTGISISVAGDDAEKQCAQAKQVATALHAQLKEPPRNPYASPFHSKDPCQPTDQFARELGTVKAILRPTIVTCEISGSGGRLLVSQEIENLTDHAHGDPLTVAGKEAMRHQETEQKDQCMVMVLLKDAPDGSQFTVHYEISSTSDPCGKATRAANDATTLG